MDIDGSHGSGGFIPPTLPTVQRAPEQRPSTPSKAPIPRSALYVLIGVVVIAIGVYLFIEYGIPSFEPGSSELTDAERVEALRSLGENPSSSGLTEEGSSPQTSEEERRAALDSL